MAFKTRITELLEIEHPIVQGGMQGVGHQPRGVGHIAPVAEAVARQVATAEVQFDPAGGAVGAAQTALAGPAGQPTGQNVAGLLANHQGVVAIQVVAEGLAQALAFGVAADDGPGRIEQGQALLGVTEEDRFVELSDQLPVARLAVLQGEVGGLLLAQVDVDAIQLDPVVGVVNQQVAGVHPDATAVLAL